MPKKTIKEMTVFERHYHSIEAKVFHSIILASVILGMVALCIGFGLYSYALGKQYVSDAYNLTRNAETFLRRIVYMEPVSSSVMETYRSLTDAEYGTIFH